MIAELENQDKISINILLVTLHIKNCQNYFTFQRFFISLYDISSTKNKILKTFFFCVFYNFYHLIIIKFLIAKRLIEFTTIPLV